MMKLLSRICLIEFGVLMAAVVGLLAWQVGCAWWRRRRGLKAEEAVLLVGAVATCWAYGAELVRSGGGAMPGISWGWMAGFAASCAVHVAMKAVRVLTKG